MSYSFWLFTMRQHIQFLAIAVLEDWNIYSINVKTAYLYSNLNKKIYIEQLEDFRLSSKKKKAQ